MSESDDIATPPHEPDARRCATDVLDEEDRLRPRFVREVLDAVADGDDEAARALVETLHPADIADLIELAPADERADLIAALAGIVDADVYAELNEHVREDMIDEMEPQQVADLAAQLDTDDAVAIIEDLEERRAARRAPRDGARRPRRGRGSADLCRGDRRPPDAARPDRGARTLDRRPGDRLSALVRRAGDRFLGSVRGLAGPSPGRHLQTVDHPALRPRSIRVDSIMIRKQTLIPVDLDQEEVALKFQKYALISAAVVDPAGRLVGMITVDDIVHIIQEEAGEDALLLSGAGDGDINEPIFDTYKERVRWLAANLMTALVASAVIRFFEASIERLAVLAVLMPIVAGVGGNAGTQTLAVTVRAIATNQLTGSNRWRAVGREIRVALMNGLTIALLIGVGGDAGARLGAAGRGDRRGDADQHRHRRVRRGAGPAGARTRGRRSRRSRRACS